MPYKDPKVKKEHAKNYGRKWYLANKDLIIARNKIRRKKEKRKWIIWKSKQKCNDCGFSHPAVIDFHHVKNKPKNKAVNTLIKDSRFTAAYKEAKENCIPLCANCHRILHWNESRGTE